MAADIDGNRDDVGDPAGFPPAGRTATGRTSWPIVRYDQEAWRRGAACRHLDQELFFPTGTTMTAVTEARRAKAVCAACPVRLACLQFALTTNQEFGVWGGYDEGERRDLRRAWRSGAGR